MITGGKSYLHRLDRALIESFTDSDFIFEFEKGRPPSFKDNINNYSTVICRASSVNQLLSLAALTADGMIVNHDGKEARHVFPLLCICVSKRVLGDLINSVSLNRKFKLIDIDNEDNF